MKVLPVYLFLNCSLTMQQLQFLLNIFCIVVSRRVWVKSPVPHAPKHTLAETQRVGGGLSKSDKRILDVLSHQSALNHRSKKKKSVL